MLWSGLRCCGRALSDQFIMQLQSRATVKLSAYLQMQQATSLIWRRLLYSHSHIFMHWCNCIGRLIKRLGVYRLCENKVHTTMHKEPRSGALAAIRSRMHAVMLCPVHPAPPSPYTQAFSQLYCQLVGAHKYIIGGRHWHYVPARTSKPHAGNLAFAVVQIFLLVSVFYYFCWCGETALLVAVGWKDPGDFFQPGCLDSNYCLRASPSSLASAVFQGCK